MSANLYIKHSSHTTYSPYNTRVSSGSGYNSKNEISFDEQNEIVRNFPSTIKFSYERSTHKKVLSDIFVIIPIHLLKNFPTLGVLLRLGGYVVISRYVLV